MWTVARTLDQLTARLPPALIREDARARLRATADRLPAPLTNCVFLELWPPSRVAARDAARADLIVRIDARGRDCLIDPMLAGFDSAVRASSAWQHIAAFARAWASGDRDLDRAIEGAWIEFDLDPHDASPWLRPRLFVDLSIGARTPSRASTLAIARQMTREVYRRPIATELCDALRACIEHLPEGATLRYLGFTPDRPEAGLRLCVSRLGDAWNTYLTAIHWPGDTASLQDDIVAPMRAARGIARSAIDVLHFDLLPAALLPAAPHGAATVAVSPRLGLEYAFGRARQRGGIVDEVEMLDLMVARGWTDAAMREQLLQWPGRSVEMLPSDIWYSRVARRVSHVKLAYATGQPIVMKTYLCVFFELIAGGAMLGDRPWHAELTHGAAARSDGAPARSLVSPRAAVVRDLAAVPARTREEATGSGFAPGTRE